MLLFTVVLPFGGSAMAVPSKVDSLIARLSSTSDARHRLDLLSAISAMEDPQGTYSWQAVRLADSLIGRMGKADTALLVIKGDALWQFAYHRFDTDPERNSDSAFHWYQQAANAYEASGDPRSIAFARTNLAQFLVSKGRAKEALAMLKAALPVHERYTNRKMLVKDHGGLGRAYYVLGDLERSLDHQQLALHFAMLDPQRKDVGAILHNIGIIYQDEGRLDTAIAYYDRAIQAFRSHGDAPSRWLVSLNNMVRCHMELHQWPEASVLVQQGLAAANGSHEPWHTALLRSAEAELRLQRGDLAGALKSARTAAELNDLRSLVPSLVALSDVQLALDATDDALRTAQRAQRVCDSVDIALSLRRDVARALAEVTARTGPAEQALLYLRRYHALEDSLRTEPMRRRLAALDLRKQEVADSLEAAMERAELTQAHQLRLKQEERSRLSLWLGAAVLACAAVILLWRLRRARKAKAQSDRLVEGMLPADVAKELRGTGRVVSREVHGVTVLFTDFAGFTSMAERMAPDELHAEVDACFTAFDRIVREHGGERIKTIGDAYMAAGGISGSGQGSPADLVQAALAMQAFILQRQQERERLESPAFRMRIGLHTGTVIAGMAGELKYQFDIWGDTVNTASRMESAGEVGRVNISADTHALVKDARSDQGAPLFTFEPRGAVQAKGKGELVMYFVGTHTDRA